MEEIMEEKELLYTKTHEWLKVDGDTGIVGITDYAQEHLTDIVYVEFPEIDSEFKKEEPLGTMDSVKATSDICAPVDIKIIEVNKGLEDNWYKINKDPYNEGWIIKVKILNAPQVNELMNYEKYQEYLKTL
jgi:glycine cleavage system H protein